MQAQITYRDGIASTDSPLLIAKIYVDTWNLPDTTKVVHQTLIAAYDIHITNLDYSDVEASYETVTWSD